MFRTLALLLTAVVGSAGPAAAQASGTLTHNGTAMPIKAVVAVWDAKDPSVKFHLLPVVPTAAQVASLQKGDTMWLLETPGPDPKKWPATPYGSLRVNWGFDPQAVGDMAKAWTDVYVFGVGRPNSNLNFSLTAGELKGTLTGALKEGSTVTFAATGEGTLDKDKVTWDVKATARLLPKLAR